MPEPTSAQVAVCCRSLSNEEKKNGASKIVNLSGEKITLLNQHLNKQTKEHSYVFDHCYFAVRNNEVYKDCIEKVVMKALAGFNVSLVLFGQHGSNKSHMLSGTPEEPGLVKMASQTIFGAIQNMVDTNDFFVLASFLEVADGYIHDLINPSSINLNLKEHPQLGIYVDDAADLVVQSDEDVIRLHEQGMLIQSLTSKEKRTSTIFSIVIEQRPKNASQQSHSTRSKVSFIQLADSDHASNKIESEVLSKSFASVQEVCAALSSNTNSIPYRKCKLTQLLQNEFGGNCLGVFIGHVNPSASDFVETMTTLNFASMLKSVCNVPKRNEIDCVSMVKALRREIQALRSTLAENDSANVSEGVTQMESLLQELKFTKLQTWKEKQRMSEIFLKERYQHLSRKGILDLISGASTSSEALNKGTLEEKEKLSIEYKEKRKQADDLKDKLQAMITEYTELNQSGKLTGAEVAEKVSAIQNLKQSLKIENEHLKDLKFSLRNVQERERKERQEAKNQSNMMKENFELRYKLDNERRQQQESANREMIAEEIDRIKLETENQKAMQSVAPGDSTAVDFLEISAEKSIMAIKLRFIEEEKKQLKTDIDTMFHHQQKDIQVQELQHFQIFRQYREIFEKRMSMMEQRYRSLLEDSIQDAVYLSSRNQELLTENSILKQDICDLKVKLSMKGD